VHYGGVVIKRLLFRNCARSYAQAVTRYLNGRVLDRIEASASAATWADVQQALRAGDTLRDPFAWTDVGGLLMPIERLRALEDEIVAGSLRSLAEVDEKLSAIAGMFGQDEWSYVCAAFAQEQGFVPQAMSREQAGEMLAAYDAAAGALHSKLLDDSKKEFDTFARIGYGLGMTEDERLTEFTAVRGSARNERRRPAAREGTGRHGGALAAPEGDPGAFLSSMVMWPFRVTDDCYATRHS